MNRLIIGDQNQSQKMLAGNNVTHNNITNVNNIQFFIITLLSIYAIVLEKPKSILETWDGDGSNIQVNVNFGF